MRSRLVTIAAVLACAAFGRWFAHYAGTTGLAGQRIPLSAVMAAVVCGIAFGNAWPRLSSEVAPLTFFTTTVLRVGIVLLGLRLSLATVSDIGLHALPVVVICISTALIVVTLASRALRMNRQLGGLIAVGTSICGVTAIVAMAPLIRARSAEVSYAVACITLSGLAAMIVHPLIAHLEFAAEPKLAGVFLGTAVHDTSQVVGAAMMYQDHYRATGVLEAATVTKLVRNLSMAIVIPLVAYLYRDPGEHGKVRFPDRRTTTLPAFLLGFIAMCTIRSLGDLGTPALGFLSSGTWSATIATAQTVSDGCFVLAMAAVGLQTRLSAFAHLGLAPLLLAMLAASVVGLASWGSIQLILV
jgi:uncharacterized integral membrane protein (TIGR00698 family)